MGGEVGEYGNAAGDRLVCRKQVAPMNKLQWTAPLFRKRFEGPHLWAVVDDHDSALHNGTLSLDVTLRCSTSMLVQ